MTFEELPLYEAIHAVYHEIDNPRSDTWLMSPKSRELCQKIRYHLPFEVHFLPEQMLAAWGGYGKSPTVEGSTYKKLEFTVLVAIAHGRTCFYANRSMGQCSKEVSVDRIIAGGAYSIENCMIACSFHNGQRQNRSVEEYLKSAGS